MSPETHASPDLVRWTFAVDPGRRAAIEAHLDDLGAAFEVTQEEFGRLALQTLHHADDEVARGAA